MLSAVPDRVAAGCLAHARRKLDELLRDGGKSAFATEALQLIGSIYRGERELASMTADDCLAGRLAGTRPLWEQLPAWLGLERMRLPTHLNSRIGELLPHNWQTHPLTCPTGPRPAVKVGRLATYAELTCQAEL